jgi:hypothetical protein
MALKINGGRRVTACWAAKRLVREGHEVSGWRTVVDEAAEAADKMPDIRLEVGERL